MHHVLELHGTTSRGGYYRLFTRNGVQPQYSRHGDDLATLCVTWHPMDAELRDIHDLVRDFARYLHTQVTLYTDVIEPPYRMAPHPLDHGTIVERWNEGQLRDPSWPEGETLPDRVRTSVTRHIVQGHAHRWPRVTPTPGGYTLTFSTIGAPGLAEEHLTDSLEALSTDDCEIRVHLVRATFPFPFKPGTP